MKLDQLTYFLETARTQHIGRAAKALAISPSAISHSIAALEEELGRSLFRRKGKNIFLTEHGRLLMERAENLLGQVDVLRQEIRSDEMALRGHYRMGAAHVLCSKLLMPAWSKLQQMHPEITAEIFTLRSAQVVSGVAAGQLDFGLAFSPQLHPEIESRPILTGQLYIAVAKDHPLLKKKTPDRFKHIGQYKAILPKSFQGIDVCEKHPIFEKFGITPKVSCLVDSYEVAVEQAASSQMWCYVPDWILDVYSERIASLGRPKGWDSPYSISLVAMEGRACPVSDQLMTLVHANLN